MTKAIDAHTYAELFEVRIRGMLAVMFSTSGIQPTNDEMLMLRGETEITARDLAEISFRLGYEVSLTFGEKD